MFGIGPMELIVIAIVAMVFIGPEKLPDIMRKFGKIFVQVRRQANEVRSSFNDVIHDAEREFELERIRELQKKLTSTTPQQVLNAAMAEPKPALGPGLDEHGHALPGYDENGHIIIPPESHDYHEGHYVDGQFVKNADTFLAWDDSMNRPLSELFPLHPKEPEPAAVTPAAAAAAPVPAPAVAADAGPATATKPAEPAAEPVKKT